MDQWNALRAQLGMLGNAICSFHLWKMNQQSVIQPLLFYMTFANQPSDNPPGPLTKPDICISRTKHSLWLGWFLPYIQMLKKL